MTESRVEQIQFHRPRLKHFITEVQKQGNIMTLNELYVCDQKQRNEIILGVVYHVSDVIKKSDRQLLVVYLREVTVNCRKGKFFSLYAFNEFATSLADARLRKGDFAAFRSAYVEENTRYRIEKGCHDLQARIGIPPRTGAKIFFVRKSQITNCDTSQNVSATKCLSPVVSLERHPSLGSLNREPTTISLNRNPSSSVTETSCHSTRISPVSWIPDSVSPNHNTSNRVLSAQHHLRTCSPVHNASSRISPSTSPCRVQQIQSTSGGNRVTLQNTQTVYTYKRISELVEPEKKVNIYGVISSITKTEMYEGVLDGRVFRASDIVTFPPEGEGIANSFTVAGSFHFSDSDARRLTELRKWIASQHKQPPTLACPPSVSPPEAVSPRSSTSALPQTTVMTQRHQPVSPSPSKTKVADCQSLVSSEPTGTMLSEVKKEGNYVLLCKVLRVDILSEEMRILTVTDGTLCTYSLHFNQNNGSQEEKHSTYEVRIIILEPSLVLTKIKKGALVKLRNVKVQVALVPFSQFKGPILSFKMIGNDCSVEIFKGIEPEAVKLKRQLQDMRMKQQLPPDNPFDLLAAEPVTVTQQPGCCASSSSSSSASNTFLTNIKYDTIKYCGKEIKSISSNQTKENERSISRTVTGASRKRSLSHEAEGSERGHKLQELTNMALGSHKTMDVDITGTQSNDKVSSQIEAITNNSDHVELLVSDKQACSDSISESTEIQRQNSSKQMSSHSNNLEQTSSRTAPVMYEHDKNCAVSRKEVGEQESKSVLPPPGKKPNTSEHSVRREKHNTSISSFSSTSSKDQYKSAVSSPVRQDCKPTHESGLVPGKEHGSTIVTSSETEENRNLPSTSGQKTSEHQAEDLVKSLHKLQRNGTSGMSVAAQKLQRSITFPLSPSKNTSICSKRHLSVWLDDLGKLVTERHCMSGKAHDILERHSSQEGQEVNQTSCNIDSSLIRYGFQSSDDTMDHAMRNLSNAVMHNNLSVEPTNPVPSLVILDISHGLAVDSASLHHPSVSSSMLSAQNKDTGEEVATSKDRSSVVNESLDVRNKSLLKILPVEVTRSDGNGNGNVMQHPNQECSHLNSEDHSQVAENPALSSVEDDSQQLDLTTGLFTYNSHPLAQNLISNGQSKLQVEDEQHRPSLNNGRQLSEDEQCLPSLMSVAEEDEVHCQSPQKSVLEQSIANVQLVPVSETNSVFTVHMKQKEQDTEHSGVSEQSMQQDLLAENTPHEDNDCQMNGDETYAQFSDAIAARNSFQQCTSTQSSGNQNKNPVLIAGCSGDDEMSDGRSVASEKVPSSEVDDLDSTNKFSALTQACLTDSQLSNNHIAGTLVFTEDSSSDALSADIDSNTSLSGAVQRHRVSENSKSIVAADADCNEQDDGNCSVIIGKCMSEEEHMELSSPELDDSAVVYREMFASGITAVSGMVPANISYIKRKRTNEKEVYLLKAWVKDIEPPIHNSPKMNIIMGLCSYCNNMQSYEALVVSGTNDPMCEYCFQEGKKMPVELGFLLRLYLIDENDDELIATVSAHHGVELLGCTANAYRHDNMTRRRVRQMLTKLIEKNKNGPLQNRGPLLKLLIVPVCTSVGIEYIVHNTYLLSC
ncbi:uncharacterized protein LOC111867891 isoform X3 [Cryptotermes secundus]|uniref:uncharacterized protein LOC111867891 isoform X3 n=1 Tax=Cryptotermes secundus TaxID=105785 RepID=UPI000CD7AD5C|nr:uncharacterized protein LOC111867891 isoform X3 [Cryptotermes secundus]